MDGASAPADGVYRGHLKKIETAAARRTKPFDEAAMQAIANVDGLIDVLAGDMQLPGPLEGQLLMTLASAVQQQGGQGVKVQDEPWMLLDLVLVARHCDPKVPACLIAEIMLKAQVPATIVDGKEMSISKLFASEYEQWSAIPDPEVAAGNHFKFGYALLVTEGDEAVPHALDQFALAAKHPEHTNNTADIIAKVLEAAPGHEVVSPGSGLKYTVNPNPGTESKTKVLINGKPVGEVQPSTVGSIAAGGASASTAVPATATAAPAAATTDDADNTMLFIGAAAAVAFVAVGAWAFLSKSKQ